MTDRYLKSRASLSNGSDRTNVAQIQARINTLCIHIERYGHYIHVARTLTVTEERPLNALRTGEVEELSLPGGSTIAFSDETAGTLLDYWIKDAASLETAADEVRLQFPPANGLD